MFLSLEELFEKLRNHDESVEIEVKRGEKIDKSILETVCSFSNEPGRGGGYLLLGVARKEDATFPQYEVVGVNDPDKLQTDLASQCRSMFNIPIRPQIFVDLQSMGPILRVFIPEVVPEEKPVFFTKIGLPRGAYRRIGSSDQSCTEEDIVLFHQQRGHKTFDETVVPELEPSEDFDSQAIEEYRKICTLINPEAVELRWNDEELLYALGATARYQGKYRGTICGLMVFGSQMALRRLAPLARVDYIRVEGREWKAKPDDSYHTIEYRGPLLTLIPRVVAQVLDDIPKAFFWQENDVHRHEIPLIPRQVIRESVVNALMHRSYRIRQPVQIIRYSNRIEIRNPGHSLKPDDRLGEPGSIARNEKIAAILHETGLAETKGSGIRVMRELMKQSNLTLPFFESDREQDLFTTTLLVHHFFGEEDVRWLASFKDCSLTEDEARAVVFVRELGAINNAAYRDINQMETLVASGHLRRLRDHGVFEQKGKGAGTYYVPGHRFLRSLRGDTRGLEPEGEEQPDLERNDSSQQQSHLSGELDSLSGELDSLSGELDSLSGELDSLSGELPEELRKRIEKLGKRGTPGQLDDAVVALCSWRELSLHQLEVLTGRSAKHLHRGSIQRLLSQQQLFYTIPQSPHHL